MISNWTYHFLTATFYLLGCVLLASGPAEAQLTPRPASKTQSRVPDLQGYWMGTGGIAAAFDLELGEPAGEGALQGRATQFPLPHVIVDPPDGKIPYQPWAAAVRDENRKHSLHPTKLEDIDSLSRCFQMGVPRMEFLLGMQIVQSDDYVLIIQHNASRTIELHRRSHIPSRIKLWAGDSVGHWEGNTLVVDVTNISDSGWYDWAGNFHSDELHLVERWTKVDDKTINYKVTSYDPRVFTRSWTLEDKYVRDNSKDPEVLEQACYENERDVKEMLRNSSTPPSQLPNR